MIIPAPLRALVEAARRASLLDPAAGARLVAAAPAAVAGGEGLGAWLPASGAVGPQLARKLQALLAPPGLRFGRFTAHARLGQADAVDAWLAGDGDELVLVRCLAAGAAGDEARQRFAREAECARRLSHPHIVPCLDSGAAADGSPYLVFESRESGDLGDLVQVRGGRLAPRHALSLLLQATDGLNEAHRLGLVHRDLSPESILVDPLGTAKLFGFGLAAAAAGDMTQLTLAGSSARNTLYHAPEQVLGVGHVDVRADIYALGGILAYCLTGQPPFSGRPPEIMHAKLSGRVPDLLALRPEVGQAAAQIVATCLARDPEQRYRDPAALSAALLQARLGLIADGQGGSTSTGSDGGNITTGAHKRRQLALAGTLADMPIGDVLQAMQRLRATGVLRLVDARGDRGLVVEAGLPVALAFDHPDDVLGLVERLIDRVAVDRAQVAAGLASGQPPAAVLERLAGDVRTAAVLPDVLAAQLFDEVCRRFGDSDGSFELLDAGADPDTAAAVERGRRHAVRLNPDHLLTEAARQLDEGVRLRRRVPGPWALPAVVDDRAAALRGEHIAFPERAILAAIDGRTAVRDLPARAHAPAFAVHRLLAAAIPAGSLRVPDADESAAAAAPLVVADDVAGAEPLLRAALAARPDHPAASALWAACIARSELPTALRRPAAPSVAVAGEAADAYAGGWLSLLTAADGSGPALHLFAGDEVTLGKSAREPVRISLRKYPVETNVEACQQISRAHCRIEIAADGAAAVRHLGGGNGTRLDGRLLETDRPAALTAAHDLDVAGVVQLRVRRLELDADPPLPGAPPTHGLAGVALCRQGNRAELGYALVATRVTVGGVGADLPLPGLTAGRHLALARWEGRWWWSAGAPTTWRPVAIGASLPCAGLQLTATVGDPRFYG